MKNKITKRLSLNFIFLLVIFFPFGFSGNSEPIFNFLSGVVFEIETTDFGDSPNKTENMSVYVAGTNIKMDISASSENKKDGRMIFRGDRGQHGEMIMVDDASKSYFVLNEDFAKDIQGQMSEVNKMMEDAMKNMSPEQRAAIERAQKQGMTMPGMPQMPAAAKTEIRKTSERANKAGYACAKFELLLDGLKVKDIWTTDWDNIEGGDEARVAFRKMADFFELIGDGLGKMPGENNPFDEMNFENGFPVLVQDFDSDGTVESESFLVIARRQDMEAELFEVPAGYARQSMGN